MSYRGRKWEQAVERWEQILSSNKKNGNLSSKHSQSGQSSADNNVIQNTYNAIDQAQRQGFNPRYTHSHPSSSYPTNARSLDWDGREDYEGWGG